MVIGRIPYSVNVPLKHLLIKNLNLCKTSDGLGGQLDNRQIQGVGLRQTVVPQVVPKAGDAGAGVAHVCIDERHNGEDAAHLGVCFTGEHLDDLPVEVV